MNIRELYDKGYRRFRFSDGEVREPVRGRYKGNGIPFEVPNSKSGDVGTIFYLPDGTPNVRADRFPAVIGVAEDGSMSEQSERSKRDEVQRAVERGLLATCDVDSDEVRNEMVARVLAELDSLVERWTDEETAEDLSRTLKDGDEYKGMRLKVVDYCEDYNEGIDPPIGATGTVVKDDQDGIPGVQFDEPWSYLNDEGTQYKYTVIETTEKVEE